MNEIPHGPIIDPYIEIVVLSEMFLEELFQTAIQKRPFPTSFLFSRYDDTIVMLHTRAQVYRFLQPKLPISPGYEVVTSIVSWEREWS